MAAIAKKSKVAIFRSASGEDEKPMLMLHEKNTNSLQFQFLESAPGSDSQEVSKLFPHETAIRRLQNMEEIIFQILSGAEVHL